MRVIQKADNEIEKVWHEGRIQHAVYRLPSYHISAEIKDGTLLLNTVTGELILLTADEEQKLSYLPCEYAPWMDELIKKHFLVKAELDDKKTVDSLRLAMRTLKASREITYYTILPTTNCNARCFYCFEAGYRHETMSDETADKLVDFMDAHRGGKPLHIGWFGGEPLVGIHQIDRISKILTERNIEFSSSMISNAYLFNEEIAERAKNAWKLKDIQVTLDGTEEIYNKTKAYINPCESPYKKVLDNIGFLLKNSIKVCIRLNLGLHNADDLRTLVDEIANYFENKTNLGVYVNLLYDNCGFEPVHFDSEQTARLYEEKRELDEKILKYSPNDYREKLPKLCTYCCMTDNDFSLVISPNGMLGKCEHYVQSHVVGSLETGITDKHELKLLGDPAFFPYCAECPMYPACIKLKLCEPDHLCRKYEPRDKIDKTKSTMKQYYEDHINGVHQQKPEETPDC